MLKTNAFCKATVVALFSTLSLSFFITANVMTTYPFFLMEEQDEHTSTNKKEITRIDKINFEATLHTHTNTPKSISHDDITISTTASTKKSLLSLNFQNGTVVDVTLNNTTNTTTNNSNNNVTSLISLPNFKNGTAGGIVVYYHVAKTGGSTIRDVFEKFTRSKFTNFTYRRLNHAPRNVTADEFQSKISSCTPPNNKKKDYLKALHQIYIEKCTKSKDEVDNTELLEIHGDAHGMKTLAPLIKHWSELCHQHGRPFFGFTTVRDPYHYTLSYFKSYYHNQIKRYDWSEQDHYLYTDTSEDNLIKSTRPNRQCFFLNHLSAVEGLHPSFYDKCKVNETDCDDIYDQMKASLDWIGTTEKLSTESIPLLVQILSGDVNMEFKKASDEKMKISKVPIFLYGVKNETMSKIKSLSMYDQKIYDKVKNDFRFDKFDLS